MKALILAGGRLVPAPHLKQLCAEAQLVLAADSGLRHAALLALQPQAVVGDFDSVAGEVLDAYPQVPRIEFPEDKDELDLELAVELALERGASELVVLGAFGNRLDQTLAALLMAARLRRRGIPVSLHDGDREGYPLAAGDNVRLEVPDDTLFSLLALEGTRCSVTGASYELDDERLEFGTGRGLSNRALGGPSIEVHEGLLLVIVERAHT